MSFEKEFLSVNLILDSDIETRGVDAFILSKIKSEKQIRRIYSFLIFHHTQKNLNTETLINVLSNSNSVYFEGFLNGIEVVLNKKISDIYGEEFDKDYKNLIETNKIRNKIFHGQITNNKLSREDLIFNINIIKKWCENVGKVFFSEIGYDGFSNSFNKRKINFALNDKIKIQNIENYKSFIKVNLEKRR